MNTFSIEIIIYAAGQELPEDLVLTHFKKAPDDFAKLSRVEGLVTFAIGETLLPVEDELYYLFETLVGETVCNLVKDGESSLVLLTNPGDLYFTSDGTIPFLKLTLSHSPLMHASAF